MLRNVSNLLIKTVFGKKNAGTSITHVKIHHMQIPLQILNNKGMENTSCKTFLFWLFPSNIVARIYNSFKNILVCLIYPVMIKVCE